MVIEKEDNFLVKGFAGLNLDLDPELIDDNELVVCQNMLIGSKGELYKRDGMRSFQGLPTGTTIYILGQFFMTSGVIRTMLKVDTDVYFTDNDPRLSPGWTKITTFTGLTIYSGIQLNDAFYISTSGGVYKYTTGTTAALLAGSPTDADGLFTYQTQVFCFKGSTLYYTSISNPDLWTAPGGFLNVAPGDGDNIKAALPIGDRILIFKLNTTWILYLADDPLLWQLRGLNSDIGCTSKEAAKNIRGLVYFLSIRGFWVTDGVTFSRLSQNIEAAWILGRWGSTLSQDSVIAYGDEFIMVQIQNVKTYCYRYIQPRGWVEFTGQAPISGRKCRVTNAAEFIAGGLTPGTLYYTTPGVGMDGISQGFSVSFKPWNVEGRPYKTKREKYAVVGMGTRNAPLPSPTITYNWVTDDKTGLTYNIPQKTQVGTEAMKIVGPGYGRTFQLSMTDAGSTSMIEIHWINLVGFLKRQLIPGDT